MPFVMVGADPEAPAEPVASTTPVALMATAARAANNRLNKARMRARRTPR
jgi:hypothetical protein